MSDEQKTQLLNEAIRLLDRVEKLLDQCFHAHCKEVGLDPETV